MRRESLIPFLPAALAVVTAAVTVCVVTAHQPDYPARAVVYQVVMFGAPSWFFSLFNPPLAA